MIRRRVFLVLALGAVTVVAVVAGLAATRHSTRPAPPTPAATPAPPGADTFAGGAVLAPTTDLFGHRLEVTGDDAGRVLRQDPAARLDPASPAYLSAPPAGLAWQHGWGGAAFPVSAGDGPARIDAGVAAGFADTPQGAMLAACDSIARAVAAPDGIWQNVVRARYLGGGQPLLDLFARGRAETPDAARYAVVPDGLRVLPGYRPDFAVVQIAVASRTGWAASSWPMAYTGGDWRVRVPDDPTVLWHPGTPIDSLTDFGDWTTR